MTTTLGTVEVQSAPPTRPPRRHRRITPRSLTGQVLLYGMLVLLALVRLGDDAYGVAVQREIVSRAGRHPSFATVYTTLAAWKTKGWWSRAWASRRLSGADGARSIS